MVKLYTFKEHPETLARKVQQAIESGGNVLDKVVSLIKGHSEKYTSVYIYVVKGDELVLESYIGRPTQHIKIPLSKGLCGAAAREGKTIVVSDVSKDPRYIACSIDTKSEIVVPVRVGGKVVAEIDIDSDYLDAFSEEDRKKLEEVASVLSSYFIKSV